MCDLELWYDEIECLKLQNAELNFQLQSQKSKIEELERKNQESLMIKRERDDLISEIHYLKSRMRLDAPRLSTPINHTPFDSVLSIDSSQLEALKQQYEAEKQKIEEQRSMAEENCIKVYFNPLKFRLNWKYLSSMSRYMIYKMNWRIKRMYRSILKI